MPDRRCLMTVHAHPDDEASKGAGTVARYHAEGVHTVLVCCTGGEEGEILNPALDRDDVRADIGAVRHRELMASADIIGYDEVVLLGYRDSGMAGSETNSRPGTFAAAPLDEVAESLAAVMRRVRPQVVVTYAQDQSRYPHPDHIRVHDGTMAAWDAVGDPKRFVEAGPAFSPSKLYYAIWPRQRMLATHEKFLELGMKSPFDEKRLAMLQEEEPVTTSVSLAGFTSVRRRALLAHETQVDPTSPFWFGLPPEVDETIYPFDEYFLARSRVGPTDVVEDDLFTGIA